MATENTIISVPTNMITEAQIILEWNDGQWYVSNITNNSNTSGGVVAPTTATASTAGVKVPEWDKDYKYLINDITARTGLLYVSKQNTNQGNDPTLGTFWWKPLVDFSGIDSVTVEGRNLTELARDILGGNSIGDYYKKAEIDNIILTYFNNVNAKKMSDWTLDQIKEDYNAAITTKTEAAKTFVIDYIKADGITSYQQTLVDDFNANIANDNVNKF